MLRDDIIAKWGSIEALQTAAALTPDGLLGPKTERAFRLLEAGQPPIPEGRSRIASVYGAFDYTKNLVGRGITIKGDWVAKNIVSARLHTGQNVRLHRLVAEEFVRVFAAACAAAGQTPKSVQTFVPRVTAQKTLSLHSWGIAVDFDPAQNPVGGRNSWMRTAAGQRFVKVFKEAGWTWGGRWSFKDDMHFQRCYQ